MMRFIRDYDAPLFFFGVLVLALIALSILIISYEPAHTICIEWTV